MSCPRAIAVCGDWHTPLQIRQVITSHRCLWTHNSVPAAMSVLLSCQRSQGSHASQQIYWQKVRESYKNKLRGVFNLLIQWLTQMSKLEHWCCTSVFSQLTVLLYHAHCATNGTAKRYRQYHRTVFQYSTHSHYITAVLCSFYVLLYSVAFMWYNAGNHWL